MYIFTCRTARTKIQISWFGLVFWYGWAFSTAIFDLDAMFGSNFSRRVDLWGSQGLGRAGIEVG